MFSGKFYKDVAIFFLFLGGQLLHAETATKKYKIPDQFKQLMERQIFDVDLILANKVFGAGQITKTQKQFSLRHIKIDKPLFKPEGSDWLFSQLQQGVSQTGIFCDESLASRLGCTEGNRILYLSFSPEKLIVNFDVDPVLLEASGQQKSLYLPGSTVQEGTMVTDYAINQSFGSGYQHHNLRLGGTLGIGEKHVRASAQSVVNKNGSHSSQYGELKDFYFRHDHKGRHLTFGLQEMRGFYSQLSGGSVFNPREDTIALSWGNSQNTSNTSKSSAVFPVQVFMPESGRAEVFLDGTLLTTQVLGAGISELKTDFWPQGVYEVEIKTWISGKPHDVQRQIVFKDGSGHSSKTFNVWLGTSAPDRRRIYGDEYNQRQSDYQALMGWSLSYPVTDGISVNSTVHLSEKSSALELGSRLFLFGRSPLSVSFIVTEYRSLGGAVRLSAFLGKASLSGSYDYFGADNQFDRSHFSGNRSRFTGTMMFSLARKQRLILSARKDFCSHHFSQAVDYRKRWELPQDTELESQISIQHSSLLNERYGEGDFLAASGLSINFVLTLFFDSGNRQSRSKLGLEYRNTQNRNLVLNGSHNRYFDNNLFQDMTLSGKAAKDEIDFWGVSSFNSSVLRGSAGTTYYVGKSGSDWGLFSNLSGQIGITADSLNFGQGQSSSAVLLKVSDSGKGQLQANINGRPHSLERSNSLISLSSYRTHRVQITHQNSERSQEILQLDRDLFLGTVYPGNIMTLDISAWYALDVLGWVIDDSGQPISGLMLVNSRSQALTNQLGLFSMVFDKTSLTMTGYKEGKSCKIDLSNVIKQQGRQPFYRLKNIPCYLQ